MQAGSQKYPGSSACMSGGSMLALVGITERLSEDADFNISFPGGLAACSWARSGCLGRSPLDVDESCSCFETFLALACGRNCQ